MADGLYLYFAFNGVKLGFFGIFSFRGLFVFTSGSFLGQIRRSLSKIRGCFLFGVVFRKSDGVVCAVKFALLVEKFRERLYAEAREVDLSKGAFNLLFNVRQLGFPIFRRQQIVYDNIDYLAVRGKLFFGSVRIFSLGLYGGFRSVFRKVDRCAFEVKLVLFIKKLCEAY